jgi:hypothetical protein
VVIIDCLRVTQVFHTTRQIRAPRGPYYTIKKAEIAEDRPPAAAPVRDVSAIEQFVSRIRTARPCSFVLQGIKSSVVRILRDNHFGALRAMLLGIRVNKAVARTVSIGMPHFVF